MRAYQAAATAQAAQGGGLDDVDMDALEEGEPGEEELAPLVSGEDCRVQ